MIHKTFLQLDVWGIERRVWKESPPEAPEAPEAPPVQVVKAAQLPDSPAQADDAARVAADAAGSGAARLATVSAAAVPSDQPQVDVIAGAFREPTLDSTPLAGGEATVVAVTVEAPRVVPVPAVAPAEAGATVAVTAPPEATTAAAQEAARELQIRMTSIFPEMAKANPKLDLAHLTQIMEPILKLKPELQQPQIDAMTNETDKAIATQAIHELNKAAIPQYLRGKGIGELAVLFVEKLTKLFEKVSTMISETFGGAVEKATPKVPFEALPIKLGKKDQKLKAGPYESGNGIRIFLADNNEGKDTHLYAATDGTVEVNGSDLTITRADKTKITYVGVAPNAKLDKQTIKAGAEIGTMIKGKESKPFFLKVMTPDGKESNPYDYLGSLAEPPPVPRVAAAPLALPEYEPGKGITIPTEKAGTTLLALANGTISIEGTTLTITRPTDNIKITYVGITPKPGLTNGAVIRATDPIGVTAGITFTLKAITRENQNVDPYNYYPRLKPEAPTVAVAPPTAPTPPVAVAT